jgi:hypothetical protein
VLQDQGAREVRRPRDPDLIVRGNAHAASSLCPSGSLRWASRRA